MSDTDVTTPTPDPSGGNATPPKVVHLSKSERAAKGKEARKRLPLASHAELDTGYSGRDPVELLESQSKTRVQDLVPIRYGRMLVSPFTFYRGGALIMASDLSQTKNSKLRAQICGDAHLSNFGVFATPERRLVFDVNDFDETAPGPFEWDVKRLAASLEIAGRDNGFKAKDRRKIVLAAVRAYREAMADFAGQPNLKVWYAHLDVDQIIKDYGSQLAKSRRKFTEDLLLKARTRDNLQAFSKLTATVDGQTRIINTPPLVVPVENLVPQIAATEIYAGIREIVRAYRRTLQPDRRVLLEQYELVQVARKVVGVGSVGTRAWILLMRGSHGKDPLFLQAKEAQKSVLEGFVGGSSYANHGQRVVYGQRLMQESSDIFLGWQRNDGVDGVPRDYYFRQLRDGKLSFPVEMMVPVGMTIYGRVCAWSLARAHARSGDQVAIAAYLGSKDRFDQAVAEFSVAYADQNERDCAALKKAADEGKVPVQYGI